eukprot:TRINITY_DN13996_c0_g2_i2.p1 TRINITY_DN13996_c0_g2~~TRINITY_DN13996_c0_g2_i2.p1  ORF type:complete len:104 (-),score=19.99 TRINITY_DN13996_c0_g2_i2:117-428(-)
MAFSRVVAVAVCLLASLNSFVVTAADEVATNNLRGAGADVPPSAMLEKEHSVESAAAANEDGRFDESAVNGEDGSDVDSVGGGSNSSAPLPGDQAGHSPWSHV